jgi:hypothetical protein
LQWSGSGTHSTPYTVPYLFIQTLRAIFLPCLPHLRVLHASSHCKKERKLLMSRVTLADLFQVLHHRPRSMRQRHHALRPYSLPSRCSTARWRMRTSSQRRAKRDLPHLCANTASQEYDVQAGGVPPRTECSPERMYPPPPPRASTPAFGSCLRRPKSIRSAGDHTRRTRPTSLYPRHALMRAHPDEDASRQSPPPSPSLASLARPPRAHPRRG